MLHSYGSVATSALTSRAGRRRASAGGWLPAGALTVVLAVALAGCGGSGSSGSSSSGSASSDSASSGAASVSPTPTGVQAVVVAANTFLGTLTAAEKKKAMAAFTKDIATAWSNLPCGDYCRSGVPLADLDDTQLAAGKKVLQASLGTGAGTGYDQAMKILLADDQLGAVQAKGAGGGPRGSGAAPSGPTGGAPPSGSAAGGAPADGAGAGPRGSGDPANGIGGPYSAYSGKDYLLGFLGTPSATGTWELV